MPRAALFVGLVALASTVCVACPAFGQTPAPAFSTAPPSSESPPPPSLAPLPPPAPAPKAAPAPAARGDVTIGGPNPPAPATPASASPAASVAASSSASSTAPAERRSHDVWYGWQTLVVDASAIAVGAAIGATGDSADGQRVYALGYLLGGPVVHFAHGEVGRGFGSFGLRLITPLAFGCTGLIIGFAAGAHASANDDDGLGLGIGVKDAVYGALIGFFAGEATAIAIDSALLARHKEYDDETDKTVSGAVTWRPDFGLVRSRSAIVGLPSAIAPVTGATGGISGTF